MRPLNKEPPIAAILMSAVTSADLTTSLTLVRTRSHEEGSALLETSRPDGTIALVENGSWRIKCSDDGPAVLSLEMEDSGDVPDFERAIDLLLGKLVDIGGRWGIETYEAHGDWS